MHDIVVVGSASRDTILVPSHSDIKVKKEKVVLTIGSKLLVKEIHTDTGGGGVNVSIGLSRLGLRTALICALGNDNVRDYLLKRLRHERVTILAQHHNGLSGQSTILSGFHKNRIIFAHKGVNDRLNYRKLHSCRWVYLGTLLGKSFDTLKHIAQLARKRNIPCTFNPSYYLAKQGTSKLKPILDATRVLIVNKEEAQALTRTKKGIYDLLKLLQKKVPIVLITDGPNGAYATDGITTHHVRPPNVRIADTTGAGDSFSSAFTAALLYGHDIKTALNWGIAQANNVIQYFGATQKLLTKKEIEKVI